MFVQIENSYTDPDIIWAPSHHCLAEVGWYQLNLEKQWETHPGDRHLIWVWKLKKKCKTIFRESAVCLELLETTLGVIVIFLNPMTISHFYPILKCRQVISSSPSCNHWTNETWFTARVRQTLLEMSQCWTMLLLVIPEHQLRIKLVGTLSLLQLIQLIAPLQSNNIDHNIFSSVRVPVSSAGSVGLQQQQQSQR